MSFADNTPIHFIPGIGQRTAAVLHDLEIHTFGQFIRVPEQVLIALFGPSIKQVTGLVQHAPRTYTVKTPAIKKTAQSEQFWQKTGGSVWKKIQMATRVMSML